MSFGILCTQILQSKGYVRCTMLNSYTISKQFLGRTSKLCFMKELMININMSSKFLWPTIHTLYNCHHLNDYTFSVKVSVISNSGHVNETW